MISIYACLDSIGAGCQAYFRAPFFKREHNFHNLPHNKDSGTSSAAGSVMGAPDLETCMNYSVNSFKGGYIGDYMGEWCGDYQKDTRRLELIK